LTMREINIKKEREFVDQYLDLRNSYCSLLMTKPVQKAATLEWLSRDDIEAWGFADKSVLEGVALLYLAREGEVAIFARRIQSGMGGPLLTMIEKVASGRGLSSVCAWTRADNKTAARVFARQGYAVSGTSVKEYEGELHDGFWWVKSLQSQGAVTGSNEAGSPFSSD
jgi:hypothetical protein